MGLKLTNEAIITMTCHAFNTKDAEKYGVDTAIILYNLRFWLDHNKANGTHINDGYIWTYNSTRAFSELFPYWTSNKIQKLLKRLESDGIIITGNYNKSNYDKTKWYTLPEYSTQPDGDIETAKRLNGSGDSAEPIPDINTSLITGVINTDTNELVPCPSHLKFCLVAIDKLKSYECYTGKLKLDEWENCELAMQTVDDFDMTYFDWWMNERAMAFAKKPSLPNMLCDFHDTEFATFYEMVFLQECKID